MRDIKKVLCKLRHESRVNATRSQGESNFKTFGHHKPISISSTKIKQIYRFSNINIKATTTIQHHLTYNYITLRLSQTPAKITF
jgi:hypothetical protein